LLKKLFLLTFAGLMLSTMAFGSTTTCPFSNYAAYLGSGFTCTSGNLTFSAFGYTTTGSSAGVAVPASGIAVTPGTTTGNEGFLFSSGFNVGSAGGAQTQESQITFTVSGPAITQLHLDFNGSPSGTGSTSVVETYCLNGPIGACGVGNSGSISVTNPPAKFTDMVFFAAVTSVSVSKDVTAASGTGGTASLSSLTNTFTNSAASTGVPEPMSFLLLGSGLLGLGLVRRKIKG